jgi:hypothetical protein
MNKELISRQQADRAINQLLSVIVGYKQAKASNHLEDYIPERLEFILKLINQEAENDKKSSRPEVVDAAVNRFSRKFKSIRSLQVLSTLIKEVDWS